MFRHDFESAIPPKILYQALRRLGECEKVEYVDFKIAIKYEDRSVVKLLSEKFGIDVESLKLPLAEAVGDILNHSGSDWFQDEEFMATELGGFLKFAILVK